MKNHVVSKILLFVFLVVALMSCKDKYYEEVTFVGNSPIYMTREELATKVKSASPRSMQNTGKIYLKDKYIFINELNEGVHIIDNSNPAEPQNIGFIEIPGNVDICISKNVLYADSYVDIIAIDITDINNPKEMYRLANAFYNKFSTPDSQYPVAPVDISKGIVVGWEIKEVTVKYDADYMYSPNAWNNRVVFFNSQTEDVAINESKASGGINISGSLASFKIREDALYAIESLSALKVFDIGNSNIKLIDSIFTWNNIETLFINGENLFVGSQWGMDIYNISSPKSPIYISTFSHANSCDPVVVDGNYAYVTLRTGTECFGAVNVLNVVDISNLYAPFLVNEYQMNNPHGLGIKDDVLFICDGTAGLKIYDATNPLDIKMLKNYENITAVDVIPVEGLLILIAEDGLYQYDYSDLNNIKLISYISIN